MSAPEGLSPYGRLIWNLDALVHDQYGGEHVCMRAKRFAIHRCSNPLRLVNVLPITIGGRYIQCGAGRWLAITNAPAGWGEAVYFSPLAKPLVTVVIPV